MSKNSKKVTIVNSNKPLESLDNDTDIQASKQPIVTQETPTVEIVIEKKKRVVPPRTDAQKAVLAEGRKKGRESINAKNAQIQAEKEAMQLQLQKQQEQLEKLHKKEFEDKLIKKAVATKKKQIKRAAVLDEVSDDETPIEQVREMQKNAPKKQPTQQPTQHVQQRPQFIFV